MPEEGLADPLLPAASDAGSTPPVKVWTQVFSVGRRTEQTILSRRGGQVPGETRPTRTPLALRK